MKSIIKKIISVVIALTVVSQLFGVVYATENGTCGENLTWILDNGTLTISGFGKMDNYSYDFGPKPAPWTSVKNTITSVIIEDGVTTIGSSAFVECENLKSVVFADSIKEVGMCAFEKCTSLTSVKLPPNITAIERSTFYFCTSLTKVYIPSGVTSIGDHAFFRCGFENINIPNGVTKIGESAFNQCNSLISISFPDSVTEMGESVFRFCESLKSVRLSNNIKTIGECTFFKCEKLESLIIPEGVTHIMDSALFDCKSLKNLSIPKSMENIERHSLGHTYDLENIFYGGTEENWVKIEGVYVCSGARPDNTYFNCTIVNTDYIPVSIEMPTENVTENTKNEEIINNVPEQISGTFKSSSDTFVGETFFYYNENDFSKSAYTYNHYLAKMSLRLAMSAFAEKSGGYATQYKNAKDLLDTLKFQNIKWNDSYTKQPNTNSIGVIAGNKKISYEDGDYTLIAIAIRGGGYESEWGGNFNVGNEDLHTGFRTARDHVLGFLTDYVSENSITGNVKIWITGYSRAAATTNLTAAYLDTHKYIFGEKVNMTPENIYAYCFETPAGVKNPPVDEKYNNIFSIVNRNDFVPMVVMDKWNYGRYGVTYYLPSAETNSNYNELLNNMQIRYDGYVTSEHNTSHSKTIEQFSEYALFWEIYPSFSLYLKDTGKKEYKNMGEFLQKVVDELAITFENPANYSKTAQEALIYVGQEIIGKGNTQEFLNLFKEKLMEKLSIGGLVNEAFDSLYEIFSDEELSGIIYDSLKDTFKELGVSIENEALNKLVSIFVKLLDDDRLTTLLGNIDIIPVGHYPELCLAWLDVADETTFTNKDKSFVKSQGITVTVNGSPIMFDQPPVLQNDRTLVPLRAIFEALGATVEWNNDTQTVTSTKDGKTIILTIGSNILYVNGTPITLDVPAQLLNGRTLVPVRAVAESFECNVDWNGSTQTVVITK